MRGCVGIVVVWIILGAVCDVPLEFAYQSDDASREITYSDAVRTAMCQARCFKLFMDAPTNVEDDPPERFLIPPKCDTSVCNTCLQGCAEVPLNVDPCNKACNSKRCVDICKSLSVTDSADENDVDNSWKMSSPRTMCNSLVGTQIRGVTLQWNLVNATTSEILRYPLPVAFVVQMRTQRMASNDADAWTALGTGRHGLVPITNLSRERHQFRVTAVTRLGPKGRPLTTPWTSSSEDNLKAPVDVRVTKSTASGYSITSKLSWSYQESDVPSCNYVIDLLPDKGAVPSAHFRLSKPYDLFSFDMGQLAFSTNYVLHIRATDTLGEKKSLPATSSFLTPSCLDCYHFNFSLCAPGPPSQLKVRKARSPTTDLSSAGVQIVWSPPAHASPANKVLQYQVSVMEDLFHLETKPIRAQRIVRSVDGDTQVLNIGEVQESVRYRVSVRAQSPAGVGPPAVTEYLVQDGDEMSATWLWIIGASIAMISTAAVLATWRVLRRRRHQLEKLSRDECFGSTSSAKNPAPPPEFVELKKKALQVLKKSSDPYELPYESVHIEEVIGQGAFAVVHRAYAWIGKVRETVAVKTLKQSFTPEEKRGLLQEIELLKLVGPHPNIVSLRACCTTGSVMALLLEYCPLGDLKTYLTKIRRRNKDLEELSKDAHDANQRSIFQTSNDSGICEDSSDVQEVLSAAYLLSLVRQVARGMEFLASKRIVHRDLAARNILLLTKQQVKIADLGLSRDAYEEGLYRKTTGGRLPVRWMAVESLSHFTYTPMSDVWSFGVLMWEVMTLGAVPYPGVNNHEVLQYLLEGNRLNRPSDCAQDVYDIMASCWNSNPISRPCFGQIIQSMDSIMEESLDYFHFD